MGTSFIALCPVDTAETEIFLHSRCPGAASEPSLGDSAGVWKLPPLRSCQRESEHKGNCERRKGLTRLSQRAVISVLVFSISL